MSVETPGTGEGLASRLLREVLRTPAFRELVLLHLGSLDPDDARAALRVLIDDAVEMQLSLSATAPAAVNAASAAALELGRQLARLPEPLLAEYLESLARAVDRDSLRELPRVWGPLLVPALPAVFDAAARAIEALARSLAEREAGGIDGRPPVSRAIEGLDGAQLGRTLDAVATLVHPVRGEPGSGSSARRPIAALVETADFGKLRHAAAALSAAGREAALAFIDEATSDPVVIANLMVAVPPLVNDQVAVARSLLSKVSLPDELMASSVFALLEDLDARGFGELLGAVARLINTMHRGSLVLGASEPAFRAVLAERVEKLLSAIDGDELHRALVALGEDGETAAAVLADLVRRDPALPGKVAATALAGGAPLLRGLVELLREVNGLPDEAFQALAAAIDAGLERGEIVALAREAATLLRRSDEVGAVAPLVRALVAALDQDAVDEASRHVLRSLGDALGESGRVRSWLDPEAVGSRITRLLRRLNEAFDAATADRPDYLSRVMAAIDADELERAWDNALSALTGTRTANASLTAAVVRPVLVAGWRSARTVLGERRPTWSRRRR